MAAKVENEYHGYFLPGQPERGSLHVGMLPGRKRPALYLEAPPGEEGRILAFFKTEDDALLALDFIDTLAFGIMERWESSATH